MLTDDEVLARYPGLRPLLEMEPPWRFGEIIGTLVGGKRESRWRVDTLLISAEDRTVASRRPTRRRTRHPASEVDFVGSLDDAVRLLQDDRRS
ncbi:MAG TPA: hypothetical protein VGR06_24935 [Actinophytocola sp.]|jgi:hypothetical protein|uniref:hypothetical protein n=1 Tax=Actinophytocola sp. TaxID=1872138 RepID=UPI002E0BB85D|nr:hypothetical protein [Actinophytocola sp.]